MAGSGAGDLSLYSDSFTRADETPIASPYVAGPATWTDLNLGGNNVEPPATFSQAAARINLGSTANQWTKGTLITRTGNTSVGGPLARIASTSDGDCYTAELRYNQAAWALSRYDDTGGATVAGTILVQGGTPAVNDVAEIRCIGTLHAHVVNGTYLLAGLDATYASGQPGIYAYAEGSATGSEWDDFETGNITPTRFYFPSVTGTVPITPTQDGGWGDTEDLVRRCFYPFKSGSAAGDTVIDEAVTTNPLNVIGPQYICPFPLAQGQTIKGTVRGIIRCLESNGLADMCAQWCWKVWDSAGNTAATLLAIGTHTLTEEPGTSTINRRYLPAFASTIMTAYTVPTNTATRYYIGCEIGCRSFNTVTTNRTWTMALGDPVATADCTEDITGTTGVAWAEFDSQIYFAPVLPHQGPTPYAGRKHTI